MSFLKKVLSLMPEFIQDNYLEQRKEGQYRKWLKNGNPIPVPHIVKQKAITLYQQKHDIENLIETGTYLGDMIWAQRKNFKYIYSIELNEKLAKRAKNRFRKHGHITIVEGDSGEVLHKMEKEMKVRTIFWLDGHYSSGITSRGNTDCPIYGELQAIFKSGRNHILLIDDARDFIGKGDYPSIEELSAFILKFHPNSPIEIKDDIIRVELSLGT